MAGALIGKEYIGDNIKEAANRNGVDVVKDTSDTEKKTITQLTVQHKAQGVHSLMQPKRIHSSHRCQP